MNWEESQAYWQLEFEHTRRKSPPEWFGYWLSGFVDGEGSFKIAQVKHKKRTIYFSLVVRLRDDDSEILYLIRDTLQVGTVHRENKAALRKSTGKNVGDQIAWQCHSLLHCHRYVVPFFRRYPLRTKKARDFEFWSQAVEMAYKSYGTGVSMPQRRYNQIVALKLEMEATRAYNG